MLKKIVLPSLVALTAFATIAAAYPGKGYGSAGEGGKGKCGQNSERCGSCPQQGEAPELSDSDAKKAIEDFVEANLAGYNIGTVQSYATPRGVMFTADAVDAAGNKFILHVNPWGVVRGPFLPPR